MVERETIAAILGLARWAPSGDNTQNWRFEIKPGGSLTVHGFDTRDHCVYDLDGHPSQISLGALLETMAIAATAHGLRAEVTRRSGLADAKPTFDVRFVPDGGIVPDPLIEQIRVRSVQRRPMRTRRLTLAEKQALERSIGVGYRIVWLEGLGARWRAARLMFANAHLRLTMPEAYRVHRDIIEWGARYSADKVPDRALGADPLTLRLMRWVMADWKRVVFFNKYLAGTLAPRVQMDLLPGLLCGAHFAIVAEQPARSVEDYVAAGRAVQRFWLTLTSLQLAMQPEMTPLIFARYVREGRSFSDTPSFMGEAESLSTRLQALMGESASAAAVFAGRIGAGPAALARSTRKELGELIVASGGTADIG